MRLAVLTSLLVLAASLASPAVAAQTVGWSDLIDKVAQHYEDPYRALAPRQLELLVSISRLRERTTSSARTGEDQSTIEQQLRMKEAKLAAKGINVDWLISQRWTVAKRRERAATAGNKYVDGQVVIIAGFAIPAPADPDGTQVTYLMPERGMCSHMPPPPPNQMIRLRLKKGWVPDRRHAPVRVRGVLRIAPSENHILVVDGRMPMHATFAIEDAQVARIGMATLPPSAATLDPDLNSVQSED
jgi:hypothetical protein